ncbi:MAG: hypothetical protein N2255_07605 [Kiritimatiellae bacterium]|nr:hypothetical protein [Kiritimatiellia bacterium]
MNISDQLSRRGIAQERFARILELGTTVGATILGLAFVLYLLGTPRPAIPIERVPDYWNLSAVEYGRSVNDKFLRLARPPTGWHWVRALPCADYLNFVGIAILALTTPLAFAAILPILFRQRRWAYFIFGVIELFVFILAASGVLPVCR